MLVRKRGADVLCRPLAGTARDAATLLASDKDRREHRVVVDAVRRALGASCTGITSDDAATFEFADVTHFGTTIRAEAHGGASIVDLVDALHPTPAVCGDPRDVAADLIRRHEGIDRGAYAAPIGWVDRQGNGEFAVGVRSAEVTGNEARLFAGVGVVADSEPEAELDETRVKLQAMLGALIRP